MLTGTQWLPCSTPVDVAKFRGAEVHHSTSTAPRNRAACSQEHVQLLSRHSARPGQQAVPLQPLPRYRLPVLKVYFKRTREDSWGNTLAGEKQTDIYLEPQQLLFLKFIFKLLLVHSSWRVGTCT